MKSMNKEQFIEALKNGGPKDENDWEWWQPLVAQLEDRFAAGYLSAQVEKMNGYLSSTDQEFKEELLKVAKWEIWDI